MIHQKIRRRHSLGAQSLGLIEPFSLLSYIAFHPGTVSHLSVASETEISEVINFLSGLRPRSNPDDADTESVCSTRVLSDSGIESVNNAKLGVAVGKTGGSGEITDDQTKGKKGKKKDKKAAAKTESFNKKKKKKRGDRKKEKKKAAAEEQENERKKEEMNTITEGKCQACHDSFDRQILIFSPKWCLKF